MRKAWYRMNPSADDLSFYIELFAEKRPEEERRRLLNILSEKLLNTDSRLGLVQTALDVRSSVEGALKFIQSKEADLAEEDRVEFFQQMSKAVLHTDSPVEVVQTALQVRTPEEAALELIQNDEQLERLQELIRQRNLAKQEAAPHPA